MNNERLAMLIHVASDCNGNETQNTKCKVSDGRGKDCRQFRKRHECLHCLQILLRVRRVSVKDRLLSGEKKNANARRLRPDWSIQDSMIVSAHDSTASCKHFKGVLTMIGADS
jgi:hypothetical protein